MHTYILITYLLMSQILILYTFFFDKQILILYTIMYSLLYFYFHSTKIRHLLKTLRYTQTLGPTVTLVLGMQGKKEVEKKTKKAHLN